MPQPGVQTAIASASGAHANRCLIEISSFGATRRWPGAVQGVYTRPAEERNYPVGLLNPKWEGTGTGRAGLSTGKEQCCQMDCAARPAESTPAAVAFGPALTPLPAV